MRAYGDDLYGGGTYGDTKLELSSITLDGVALDLHGVLADVTIRHGRVGVYDTASPSTAQLVLLGVDQAFTRAFELGELLVVNASDGYIVAPRFTGRLTDGSLVENELTAIAVGNLRVLSGYTVGTTDWPEEKWSQRVTRAFGDAGLASSLVLQMGAFDPLLVARPAATNDPVALGSYLDELAGMVEAAVADLPDGRILVQEVGSRALASVFALDPGEVVRPPEWTIQLPGANVVTVTYGDPDASAELTVEDAASVAAYGPIAVRIDTTLKTSADASTVGTTRLARNAYGHWNIAGAELLAGRRFAIGTPLALTMLPAASPFDPWQPILEGWTDHVFSDGEELDWTMDLALSDPLLSGLTVPWNALPAAITWASVDPALSWREALTLSDFA
jgi:hypothetical protein